MAARVKLGDVAMACGVDISTVSRALSGDARVRPETRRQISAAAQKLGYRPNLAARNLAAGRSMTVLFIMGGLDNPIEREPCVHAAATLRGRGYDMLVALRHGDNRAMERIAAKLEGGMADGALLIPGGSGVEGWLVRLMAAGYPIVLLDRGVPGAAELPLVTTDNQTAAAKLVELCANEGCREIVSLFHSANTASEARRLGVEAAVHAISGGPPIQSRLLQSTPASPCAVIANTQADILEFANANADTLKGVELVFATFDTWIGSPIPAKQVWTAIQDFAAIGNSAANTLANLIEQTGIPLSHSLKLPPREFRAAAPR